MPTSTVLDSFRLDGKVAIVTGASSGLGVAFAAALAQAGADVVVAARRADALGRTRRSVAETGQRVIAVRADLTKPDDAQGIVDTSMAELGRVDVLATTRVREPPCRPRGRRPISFALLST